MARFAAIHIVNDAQALQNDQRVSIVRDGHGGRRFGAGKLGYDYAVAANRKVGKNLGDSRIRRRTSVEEVINIINLSAKRACLNEKGKTGKDFGVLNSHKSL